MRDADCIRFLQSILPSLGMQWRGYRKVRRQVCRRITLRMAELGIRSTSEYEKFIAANSAERGFLEDALRITISRFYRDRDVFDALRDRWLPALLEKHSMLRCWSIGCASGEEPYTLALIWHLHLLARFPGKSVEILASDADAFMLARAREAIYEASSLREMPRGWKIEAFEMVEGGRYRLRRRFRESVRFLKADILDPSAVEGPFQLVLCRNLAFMYFDDKRATHTLAAIQSLMTSDGLLVVGKHDRLPSLKQSSWDEVGPRIFRRQL